MLIVRSKGVQLLISSMTSEANKSLQKIIHFSPSRGVIFNTVNAAKKYCTKGSTESTESNRSSNPVEKTNDPDIADHLIKWAVQNNINNYAFSKLLQVLTQYGIKGLPKNSKALLQAKEADIKVSQMPPGIYTHFGLKKNLKSLILAFLEKNLFNESDIFVSIFIDELPLVKLTHKGLWVILGSVEGFTDNIFFIGAYCGYSKPSNSNLFLSEFVEEAKELCEKGLEINNAIYTVKIKRLICDIPAKSFVLNIKNHLSYSSCTKCNTVGEFKNKKICFLEESSPRKDEDFENNEMYLNDKTCLLEIPNFGVVSNVTLDYMHLVCLGVVQKLLSIWLKTDEHWICENSASDMIRRLAQIYPCEFQTKPKSFKIFNQWIANDFRQFLLYYGPVVLKNNLKEKCYNHFLLLHIACRLLCIEASKENIDCGRQLLNDFVKNYKKLYKAEQISHNIHGLYHLADECTSHGILDNFSAFPFEKFLMKLKNSMESRKKKLIPQTILRESYLKIYERSLHQLTSSNCGVQKKIKTNEDDKFNDNFFHYKKLSLRNFSIIPSSEGDNYVFLKNGKIVQVTDVLIKKGKSVEHFLAGKKSSSVSNFHSEPFEIFKLSIFKVQEFSETVDLWPVNLIENKVMKVPTENEESVMIGLLSKNF